MEHLTDLQTRVLRRIADGTEPITQAEPQLSTTVYALRSRRLVTTSGSRPYTNGVITELGRAVLAGQPLPRRPTPAPPALVASASPKRAEDTTVSAMSGADLLATLLTDGQVVIPSPSFAERAAWRRSIHAAKEIGVPPGKGIRHTGRDAGDLVIRLVGLARQKQPKAPIDVPVVEVRTDFRRCHPSIASTRRVRPHTDGWVNTRGLPETVHVNVTKAQFHRALLLVDALFREAERRGHLVTARASYGCNSGGLGVEIDAQHFEIALNEPCRRQPHQPTDKELAANARYSWNRIPEWDHVPTGGLVMSIGHNPATRLAADGVRWRLESRIGHVIVWLETEAHYRNERERVRAEEKRRREEENERAWKAATERAKRMLVETTRTDALKDLLDRASRAEQIRDFLASVHAAARDHADDEEWVRWIAGHAEAIDPLNAPLVPPTIAAPTSETLEPFLDGWSFYGPERSPRYQRRW